MAKMNKSNGYSVSSIFGKSERLINVYNLVSELATEFGVNKQQIKIAVVNKNFQMITYSREKMSYGYNGQEVFTVKQEAEKFRKFVEENIQEISGIIWQKPVKKPVVLQNQITGEKLEFRSQLEAARYLEYKIPNAVTLRIGSTRKIDKGVFTVLSK